MFTEFDVLELKGISLITDIKEIESPMQSTAKFIWDNKNSYFIKGRPSDYIKDEFKRIQGVRE